MNSGWVLRKGGGMKLSEILGWDKKDHQRGCVDRHTDYCDCNTSTYNTALTSCDREIDREALARMFYEGFWAKTTEYDSATKTWPEWNTLTPYQQSKYYGNADFIISTMPTWLKRSEK